LNPRGALVETYVLHERQAHLAKARPSGQLAYGRTPSGSEVDLVWSRGSTRVGIEVKPTRRWRREDASVLADLLKQGAIGRGFGVYLGAEALAQGGVRVLPLRASLEQLGAGKVIG
jgi:predicted AAA+ superfamily ATPase